MRLNLLPATALVLTGLVYTLATAGPDTAVTVISANRSAVGAGRFESWAALAMTGSRTIEGGIPGRVSEIVDLHANAYRSTQLNGAASRVEGYDGIAWVAKTGIVNVVDLPGLRRDAVTMAYIKRQAWLDSSEPARMAYVGRAVRFRTTLDVLRVRPANGSPADLWFDRRTHLLARAVLHTDFGLDQLDYGAYRAAGGAMLPREIVETDPTGEHIRTTFTAIHTLATISLRDFGPPPFKPAGILRGSATIPFRSDSPAVMAHIVLPISMSGQLVYALFDSGGQNSLSPAAASRLHLRSAGSTEIVGSGGSEMATVAQVSSVNLGGAALSEQRFTVLPLPYQIQHPTRGLTVGGIVGAEILANFKVRIDYAHRRLTLLPFGHGSRTSGVTLPFYSDGSHAYVNASIDGVRGIFGIDTGDSGGVTVFSTFARRQRLFQTRGLRYVGIGVGGTNAQFVYRGRDFGIAGVDLRAPIVQVPANANGALSSSSVAGNFGANVLSRFTLTFDYRARTVTFEPNASANGPFQQDRTGMTVHQRRAGTLDVISVASDTPAFEAGLRAGDQIVAVGGHGLAGFGAKDFDAYRLGTAPFMVAVRRGDQLRAVRIQPRKLL